MLRLVIGNETCIDIMCCWRCICRCSPSTAECKAAASKFISYPYNNPVRIKIKTAKK